MSPQQVEVSKHHCLETTAMEIYALISAQVPRQQWRKHIGRGGLPHVSKKPSIERTYLDERYKSANAECWAKVQVLLRWLLGSAGKKPPLSKIGTPITQLRALSGQLACAWNRNRGVALHSGDGHCRI